MPETVLADAQFGVARILRPYLNFEADYQGQTVDHQIMMTEVITPPGGEPLDDRARLGLPGYDPALVRGLKVPYGARVSIWFPKILPLNVLSAPEPAIRYQWTIQWRLRNVFDFRQSRIPYHYPKQGAGVPDFGGGPSARVVIPAANQTVVYTQTEPLATDVSAGVAQSARMESYTFGGLFPGATLGNPFVPGGGIGAIQQGMLDPTTYVDAKSAFYQELEMQAVGDELLIGLTREDPGSYPNWAFASAPREFDRDVSVFLGAGVTVGPAAGVVPDIGVYVMVGSAP
jgi:hypothetical protein